jgi:hypothetical protein
MTDQDGNDWGAAYSAAQRRTARQEPRKLEHVTLEAVWQEYKRTMTAQERKRLDDHLAHGGGVHLFLVCT